MRMPFTAALLLAVALPAHAEWVLDNDASRLSFVTTKANTAAEAHTFGVLDGDVDDDGNVTISIDLDTVDTAIEIRDERMRSMLFETEKYPSATLVTAVDAAALAGLAAGEAADMTLEAQLMLHGKTANLTLDVNVARLSDNRILVSSRKPVIVNAGQFDLGAGVEKLREVAGLPSISPAVSVSFVLGFDQES